MSSYSPGIPSSLDPALLYSDLELERLQHALPLASFSDDLEAFQQCVSEDRATKNSAGIVIQHRAWIVADVFRSEGEAAVGTERPRRPGLLH
jgi:chromosome transmission fidelity protein 18